MQHTQNATTKHATEINAMHRSATQIHHIAENAYKSYIYAGCHVASSESSAAERDVSIGDSFE